MLQVVVDQREPVSWNLGGLDQPATEPKADADVCRFLFGTIARDGRLLLIV